MKILRMMAAVFFLVCGLVVWSSPASAETTPGELYRIAQICEKQVEQSVHYLYVYGVQVDQWVGAENTPILPAGEYTLKSVKIDGEGQAKFDSWVWFEIHAGSSTGVDLWYWLVENQLLENTKIEIGNLPNDFAYGGSGDGYRVVVHGSEYERASSFTGTMFGQNLVGLDVIWDFQNPPTGITIYDINGRGWESEFGQYNLVDLVENGGTVAFDYAEPDPVQVSVTEFMGHDQMPWWGFDDVIGSYSQINTYNLRIDEPGEYVVYAVAPRNKGAEEGIYDTVVGIWKDGEEANFSNESGSVLIQDWDNGDDNYEIVTFAVSESGDYKILVKGLGRTGAYFFQILRSDVNCCKG